MTPGQDSLPADDLFARKILPGHYASPLPSFSVIRERRKELFEARPSRIPGVELFEDAQIALMRTIATSYVPDMDVYLPDRESPWRYVHANQFFSNLDAAVLFGVLRHVRPRRLIEIGSGFSSAMVLDTKDRFFGHDLDLTFIEPFPTRLKSLLRPEDAAGVRILESRLEDIPLDLFDALEANDVLFVDSTHVMKVGSDVCRIIFEILPALRPGVWVHFHDVFYPFEYPESWYYDGRAWNEAYAVRAFLQYNHAFEIRLNPSYLYLMHPSVFDAPEWRVLPSLGCRGSLWLQKV